MLSIRKVFEASFLSKHPNGPKWTITNTKIYLNTSCTFVKRWKDQLWLLQTCLAKKGQTFIQGRVKHPHRGMFMDASLTVVRMLHDKNNHAYCKKIITQKKGQTLYSTRKPYCYFSLPIKVTRRLSNLECLGFHESQNIRKTFRFKYLFGSSNYWIRKI